MQDARVRSVTQEELDAPLLDPERLPPEPQEADAALLDPEPLLPLDPERLETRSELPPSVEPLTPGDTVAWQPPSSAASKIGGCCERDRRLLWS